MSKDNNSLQKDAANPKNATKEVKIKQLQAQIDAGKYKPKTSDVAGKMIERGVFKANGQWDIKKWDMEKRCWEGYEPTPGKKAYDKGSCQPMKKSDTLDQDLSSDELEISEFDNGDIEVVAGEDILDEDLDFLCKSLLSKGYEIEKKEWSPKAEHKSDKGGLTAAGRESYNKATGGNLKAPQPGGGPRKKSFCARNKGQIDMHGIDCKKDPEKRACKARRRWKC